MWSIAMNSEHLYYTSVFSDQQWYSNFEDISKQFLPHSLLLGFSPFFLIFFSYSSQAAKCSASQEPWPEPEIKKYVVDNFGVTFDMFSKIDVNGSDAHPLWNYLKSKQGGTLGE
jgi:Glutathione peroxidase